MAENGTGGRKKPHAVVIPYPLQGHVIPAAHLALRLAARGFAVTFVNTESVHQQTARALGADRRSYDIFAGARAPGKEEEERLDVRYELVSDGFPLGFDRSLNHDQFMEGVLHVLPAHVEELLRRLVVDPASTCLVADTFFVWPATLAGKLGVPYVSFWTEPALIFNLYYHMDLLAMHGHFKCKEPRKDTIMYIPGVPAIEPHELMSYLQETDTTSVVHRIIFKAFDEARGADYVLCNTVEELEPSTIAALRAEKPFYAVGPIFPAGFARSAVATSMWAESDCSQWLDAQPPGSVLYISFGSYAHVTRQELHEIAGGVLASGARFLWVMRPDIVSSDDPDPLPEGFAEASAGRGLVVPWCCQVEVLSHAALGGFLTHCGWNSVLESVWSGVPMLCFPLLTDQFTNRRLVVREWRVGVPIGDRGAVFADEVRARIEGVMSGKEGEELREAVEKVRTTLKAAAAQGGSSRKVVKGILHTHRLVASKWPFPKWAEAMIGSTNICYASEYSFVDPRERQMTLRTRNLTFGSVMAVDETVTYMPHPEDSNKTLQKQEAIVTVHGMPLESYMENLMTNKISVNAGKGRQAIEWVIGKLQAEMKEITSNAIHNTDDLINFTKKSLHQVTHSVEDISNVTKKSIEDLQKLQTAPQTVPSA